mgnify:CR=1 FL=1
MPRRLPEVAVVTGASSGIGAATARTLADEGFAVVLGARRSERLETLASDIVRAGGNATFLATDVTIPGEVTALADLAVATYGRIDVLVANAGVMPLSPLRALRVAEWERMVDVNVKGLLNSIAAVLPQMEAQGGGHIVTLGSVGSHLVAPAAAVYCGTKFAAWAITEGLRQESAGRIRATVISPGAVATELPDGVADPDVAAATRAFYADAIDADAVARAILYAVNQPAEVAVNEIILRPTAQAF